jgi:menaquinone-dependent protoporphyrinogen IX oxidase
MSTAKLAWVVYDSVHGNTREIAEAIAKGLESAGPVRVIAADEADQDELREARLVVLGCPTHAFSLSPGMKSLVGRLSRGSLDAVPFAAFDTRFSTSDMPSPILKVIVPIVGKRAWAATHLARAATKAGAMQVAEPEGFCVRATEGPLLAGEAQRAAAWGRTLASQSQSQGRGTPAADARRFTGRVS